MAIGVLAAVVVLVILAAVIASGRRGPNEDEEPGDRAPGGLRRFFVFALLLAAMVIAAIGVAGLIEGVVPTGREIAGGRADLLARSLAFTVIAAPAYLLLWRAVSRGLRRPAERQSLAWGLHVAAALSISLAAAAAGLAGGLRWLFGGPSDPRSVGDAIAWTVAWTWQWRLLSHPSLGPTRLRTPALLFGSLWGLVAGAVSIGAGLTGVANRAYARMTGTELGGTGPSDSLRLAAAWALVSAVVYGWYWLRHARLLPHTALWHAYVLIAGVLGGAVAMLEAGGTALYRVLEWFLGDPTAVSAADQFRSFPGLVVTGLIGLIVFTYHRGLIGTAPEVMATESGRVYRYLLSGTGLLAAASGLGVVVSALIEVAGAPLVATGGPINTLLAGLTLLVVGTPVWLTGWLRLQQVAAHSQDEVAAPSRRVYLVAVFGVGAVVALVTLIILAFRLFQLALGEASGSAIVEDIRVPMGLLVATGAAAAYHWMVWREDRGRLPARAVRPEEVTLVASDGEDLLEALRRLGAGRVRVVHPVSESQVVNTPEALAEALSGLGGARVLILTDDAQGLRLITFRDR